MLSNKHNLRVRKNRDASLFQSFAPLQLIKDKKKRGIKSHKHFFRKQAKKKNRDPRQASNEFASKRAISSFRRLTKFQ